MYGNYNYNPYVSYQPAQMMQPQPQPMQSEQKRTNADFIYVNGINQVREHIVQPNQSLYFMDNNAPIFYIKIADSFGTTQLKSYRFEEINPDSEEKIAENTISREEFENLKIEIENLKKNLKSQTTTSLIELPKGVKK